MKGKLPTGTWALQAATFYKVGKLGNRKEMVLIYHNKTIIPSRYPQLLIKNNL